MRKRQYKKNNTDKSKKINSVRASKKIYRESKHKRIKSKRVIRTPEERQQLLLIASIQSNGRKINYRLKEIEKEYKLNEWKIIFDSNTYWKFRRYNIKGN